MSQVNTLRGPIDGSRLGRTLMHEHIFVLSPEIEKPAGEWDESAQRARAVTKLRELKEHGIDTLVDLTVMGLGRYIPRVAAIAEKVPEINVVVATGVYTYNEVPMFFHFQGPGTVLGGPEPMVDLFVREIRHGVGETDVRAGILKCASDRPGITPGVERVLRAVAEAHRSTGVPITTHTPTPPEPSGLEQQRIFKEEGVDLTRVVIGHSGGTVNTDYHLSLIDNGSYLGFDHFGLPGITLEERVDAVAWLCARGYAERIVLSHDAMCFVDWFPRTVMDASQTWRWTYISDEVLPVMRERGISDSDITRMLVDNPCRFSKGVPRIDALCCADGMTLLQTELLARLARDFPQAVAWRNLADRSELTFDQWHRSSNRLARGLIELGLEQGDRVGLLIGNEEPFEWLVSYLAIHKAGAVTVPLLARLGTSELARILVHAAPSVVLCSDIQDEFRSVARSVVSTGPGGDVQWIDLLSADDADVQRVVDPDDVADIMYTSGTTGRPKGVVVRHDGLSTTDHVPSTFMGLGFITCSPFATTSGSLLVCGPLRGGLSGWFLPRFGPDRWIDTVERDRPVAGFLVPSMVELLVASPRFETADLSSLAVVNIGSAPIAEATLRRFGAGLPAAQILCGYGMTEFGAVTAMPMGDAGNHLGSVGLPLPGVQVRILDQKGVTLGPGGVGQVAVGGTRRPRGYLGDAGGTERTWVDGWLMSGDLGYVDADGHLWIVGREKEIIIRGGHNVVPGEVEAALFEHDAVSEAAVTGVAHPVLGEDVAAWVVLRQPTSTEELRSHLLARLADYKVPRRITVVDALPRNESGKVIKSQLVVGDEPRSAH